MSEQAIEAALAHVVPAVGAAPALTYSASESERFGMRVYRGALPALAPEPLLAELVQHRVDLAFVRVPTPAFEPAALARLGVPSLVADTLVYYRCNLKLHEPPAPRAAGLEFVEAGPEHLGVLAELVDGAFHDYRNHYAANPHLDRAAWLAGYKEWALGYAGPGDGRRCFLMRKNGEFVAFATCTSEGATCEGVLYGVTPTASGRGLYGDLLRFTQRFYKERGCTAMNVSTQIQNVAVQKFWASEGFRLTESYATLHLMPFLTRGRAEALRLPVPDGEPPLEAAVRLLDTCEAARCPGSVLTGMSVKPLGPLAPAPGWEVVARPYAGAGRWMAEVVDAAGLTRALVYRERE